MRNKQLAQNRIQTLNGLVKKLDMNIHRGGSKEDVNETQRQITQIIQDLSDIIDRE
jgi:UV DNA damage repair endonuclease